VHRRHDAVGGGRRRHQHELPFVADGPHRAQPAGPSVPRGLFPFANQTTFDPISDRPTGATRSAKRPNTCPLAMEFYSSNEYWVKPASLFHTDPGGQEGPQGSPAGAARTCCRASSTAARRQATATRATASNCCNPLDSAAGAARAVRGSGPVGDERQEAA
jgi:hypothetical protein